MKLDTLTLVYKHHLFDGVFDTWARSWTDKYGVRIQFIQPDTMNRNILLKGFKKRELVIASNEYADIMEVFLLNMFAQGTQETSYSRNIYLAPSLNYLTEYQTVHGSADDLANQNSVNPSATMKVVAHILDSHSNHIGLENALNQAIKKLVDQRNCTRDQGGNMKTSSFVDAVLSDLIQWFHKLNCPTLCRSPSNSSRLEVETSSLNKDLPTLGMKTALLIIDFQHDFTLRINHSSPSLETLTGNITRVVSCIRKAHNAHPPSSTSSTLHRLKDVELVHIRFLGDTPDAQHRRQMRILSSGLSQPNVGISGNPGAEFIIPPSSSSDKEHVFEKSVYDPFLVPEFEYFIKSRGIQHLVLTGLYGDVCVDATARSGFQRNLWISVVDDCVGNLHINMKEWDDLARNVYGVRKVGVESFETREQRAG